MRGWAGTLGVLAQIALSNLSAQGWKTIIVGGIVAFGAFLVVVGSSLLDSIDRGMSRSIIGSVTGNIQVYSAESKDELAVMGDSSFDPNQLEPLEDFARVRQTLSSVPNVAKVIPMGINTAVVVSGNTVDLALGRLRETVARMGGSERVLQRVSSVESNGGAELAASYAAQKDHARQIISVLGRDVGNVGQLMKLSAAAEDDTSALARAASSEFWSGFDADPLDHLEFLDNRIAPLAADAEMLSLRYIGTDPEAFARSFDRMTIVDGQAIPRGERGFLFSKYIYEDRVKLKTARTLDQIDQARKTRGARIADDPGLQSMVRELPTQVRELLLQLDAAKTSLFRGRLQDLLRSAREDVSELLARFLTVTDGDFDERYAFFYRELAPSLELYRVRIGDMLTIKTYTRGGYVKSANLRVYGTFAFKGLERSPQAGTINLMDLVSFRELYGFMTEDRRREMDALRTSAGSKDISRENAEAELFGVLPEAAPAAEVPTPEMAAAGVRAAEGRAAEGRAAGASEPAAPVQGAAAGGPPSAARALGDHARQSYDPSQLEQGVILNAAVLLKDESLLEETITGIEAAGRRDGLPLAAISWQKASGLLGQITVLMRVVLVTAVLIIFVVALVIINNALVMATLERVRELGTLRAIGAQRGFILAMLVLESVVVGLFFGAVGVALGAGAMAALHRVGIPATNEGLMFFFSGPRLHPEFGRDNLALALGVVLVVSVLSSAYPAWLAMRVSPLRAMQAEE